MFVNREDEKRALLDRFESDGFELVVIYGRRRVGKTRLVLECLQDLDHVYFQATETDNRKRFRSEASAKFPSMAHVAESWEALLVHLKDKVVVIDEFPNLILEDRSVVSEFQRIVDTLLAGTNTKLILLGSSVSMMGDEVLSYKSPLFGRKTGVIKLAPLPFGELRGFFPKTGWGELCEVFAVTGGVPQYVRLVEPPFWDWLEMELKRPDTFLREEVDFLLKYEFTDARTYKRLLEAIAFGNHTPATIRRHMGVRHSDITPYLRNLMDVDLLERRVPATEPERSRNSRYFIKDSLVSFWFRFIRPNISAIQEGIFAVGDIRQDFNTYMGRIFERISEQFLVAMEKKGMLPFRMNRIGVWWHKGEEIDLVGMNTGEKKVILTEVKWRHLKERDVERVLESLRRKAELLGLDDHEKHYCVVARKADGKQGLVFDCGDFGDVF